MAYSYALIRYDTEKEEPVRNSKGFCIEVPRGEPVRSIKASCSPGENIFLTVLFHTGETGLLVAKIEAKAPFYGYAKNKQQTEKKKLYDVFVKGDSYFNSGDLLRIDSEGFVFFQDRIGDTYR